MRGWRYAFFPVLAFAALACGEYSTGPETLLNAQLVTTPGYERFTLCKSGSSATFTYSVFERRTGTTTNGQVSLNDGECSVIATYGGLGADVTVTESSAQSGFHFDHADISAVNGGCQTPGTVVNTSSTNATVTGHISGSAVDGTCDGVLVTYYNVADPPPPGGGEGCTPGYWKQSQHFDSWTAPYTPGTLFSAVFEDAFPGMTLLQVLGQGGGGLKALGRHTVAALLNAASGGVDYDLSTTDVINGFNAVFPDGNYEGVKNAWALLNEQGCPLN